MAQLRRSGGHCSQPHLRTNASRTQIFNAHCWAGAYAKTEKCVLISGKTQRPNSKSEATTLEGVKVEGALENI